ncbi:MAG: hypothetical protein R3B06_32325 [Kofleriaceae bacterium]
MRRVLAVVVGVSAATAAAAADPLAWRGEPGCGSVDALAARVAQHLGRPLGEGDGVTASAEVVKAPLEPEVAARVTIATPAGPSTREVRGADCDAVLDAVAFVVASAVVDPAAGDRPEPRVPDPPGPTFVDASASARLPGTGPLALHVRADSWSDAGAMPELRLGLGATVAVSYRRWRGEVAGAVWPRSWTASGRGSPVRMVEVDLRACRATWRLWACGGWLAGTMEAGVAPAARWHGASLLLRWTRPIGEHWAVAASIESVVGVVRPRWPDQVGRPSPAGVRIGLGVEVIAF